MIEIVVPKKWRHVLDGIREKCAQCGNELVVATLAQCYLGQNS